MKHPLFTMIVLFLCLFLTLSRDNGPRAYYLNIGEIDVIYNDGLIDGAHLRTTLRGRTYGGIIRDTEKQRCRYTDRYILKYNDKIIVK